MKIVQIALGGNDFVVLCDDGSLWRAILLESGPGHSHEVVWEEVPLPQRHGIRPNDAQEKER